MFRISDRARTDPSDLDDRQAVGDKDLTLAFQAGDERAYREIYERHHRRVESICRRMLFDHTDAEEATQETFLRVYKALGRFNGRYQLGAWIARIATNVCLDHIRADGRRPDEVGGVELLEGREAPEVDDPQVLHLRESECAGVRKVLGQLPPLHRAAIVLREYQGMSYCEMAVALDMSEAQVKALLHRARKGFKRSWTAPLAALFPSRLMNRLRSIELAGRDEAAQVLSSTGSSVASCTIALQQCGQYVAERAVFALTAVGLGVASVAVGSATAPPSPPAAGEVRQASHEETEPVDARTTLPGKQVEKVLRAPVEPQSSTASEVQPEAAPSAPSEEPDGGGSGEEGPPAPEPTGGPDPSPQPTEPPPPPPFTPAVGWAAAEADLEPVAATDHQLALDCGASTLEQSFAAPVWRDGEAISGNVQLSIGADTGRWSMTVLSQGRDHTYSSWGSAPTAGWSASSDKGQVTVTLEGEYGPTYGSSPENAGLPRNGTFRAELTLDCTRGTVVTESLHLDVP